VTADAEETADPQAQRIAALEAELAFQGDSLRSLSDALAAQQGDLLTLQRQLRHLSEQFQTLRAVLADEGGAPASVDERPPHY
jgi:uncharacterized coiled-coil protein SlyX